MKHCRCWKSTPQTVDILNKFGRGNVSACAGRVRTFEQQHHTLLLSSAVSGPHLPQATVLRPSGGPGSPEVRDRRCHARTARGVHEKAGEQSSVCPCNWSSLLLLLHNRSSKLLWKEWIFASKPKTHQCASAAGLTTLLPAYS